MINFVALEMTVFGVFDVYTPTYPLLWLYVYNNSQYLPYHVPALDC